MSYDISYFIPCCIHIFSFVMDIQVGCSRSNLCCNSSDSIISTAYVIFAIMLFSSFPKNKKKQVFLGESKERH